MRPVNGYVPSVCSVIYNLRIDWAHFRELRGLFLRVVSSFTYRGHFSLTHSLARSLHTYNTHLSRIPPESATNAINKTIEVCLIGAITAAVLPQLTLLW